MEHRELITTLTADFLGSHVEALRNFGVFVRMGDLGTVTSISLDPDDCDNLLFGVTWAKDKYSQDLFEVEELLNTVRLTNAH